MHEFRKDPLSGRWVIIAEDRAGRPSEFVASPQLHSMARCPFCAGNEEDTPDAIATYSDSTRTDAWQVRVIPNKYPAAQRLSSAQVHDHAGSASPPASSLFVAQSGSGAHEVIIESPQHLASFSELAVGEAKLSMLAYRDRLQAMRSNSEWSYASVFKNCRGAAGATIEHAHSQLLATSILPHEIEQSLHLATDYFNQQGRCLYCAVLNEELSAGTRIVRRTSHFAAYCPYASRFPYQTRILPLEHSSQFESVDPVLLDEFTVLVREHVLSLERIFHEVAYNFWIQTAPLKVHCDQTFHWHMDLIPRVTSQAGYEWGTGCFVNSVAPETAAERLRQSQRV